MIDKEMFELIKSVEPGANIEIDIKALDGLITLIGKYKGGLQQEGFYNPKSGGWSCYESEGWEPCYQFYFQEEGKRKIYIMQIGWKVEAIRIIK